MTEQNKTSFWGNSVQMSTQHKVRFQQGLRPLTPPEIPTEKKPPQPPEMPVIKG